MKRSRQRFDRPSQDVPMHVSGVRQFEGEDLMYHQRMKNNNEQQNAFIQQQKREHREEHDRQRAEEEAYAAQTDAITRMRGMLEDEATMKKRNAMLAMQDENKRLAQAKHDRENHAKLINEAKNQMEVTRADNEDQLWVSNGGLKYEEDNRKSLNWYEDTRKSRANKMARYEALRKLVFTACDADNSKSITKSEFEKCLTVGNPGWEPMTKQQVDTLYHDITNGHGRITFAKLDGFLTNESVQKAIHMFKDHAGKDRHLSEEEFMSLMKEEGCNHRKAQKMFQQLDTRRKGYVTLVQFRDFASDNLKLSVVEENFHM